MAGAWMDYNCRSTKTDRTADGRLRLQFECTCPTGYKFSSAILEPWTDESLNAYVASLVKALGEQCIAPPPPVAPPVVPPVAPPVAPPVPLEVEECEKIGIFDIPKGLRCLWRGLVSIPDRMVNYFKYKAQDYLFRSVLLTYARILQRAESRPAWTVEDVYEVTGIKDLPQVLLKDFDLFMGGLLGMILTGPQRDRLFQSLYDIAPMRIPGSSDLVRFQLREVFDPKYREEQLKPPPSEDFYNYMRLTGFHKFWSDSYWAAHWDLPSVTDGFEMFARLRPDKYKGNKEDVLAAIEGKKLAEITGYDRIPPFTAEDLTALFVRQDKMPIYIPQLKEIAYQPVTRIDVRRMYKAKMITKEQLPGRYEDLRYSPEDAKLLAEFVEDEYDPISEIKELSLTDMEKALAYGIITDKEFDDYLTRKHFDEPTKKIEKALEQTMRPEKKVTKQKELSITDMERAVALREITADLFTAFGFPGKYDDFKKGSVTEKEFTEWLKAQNYSERALQIELSLEKVDRGAKLAAMVPKKK